MTPQDGPSQCSGLSLTRRRYEAAEVGEDLVQVLAGQERLEQPDRRELDIVAPADRERVPVPGQRGIGRVGPDDDVGGGVVRRRVHRVGPGERAAR